MWEEIAGLLWTILLIAVVLALAYASVSYTHLTLPTNSLV